MLRIFERPYDLYMAASYAVAGLVQLGNVRRDWIARWAIFDGRVSKARFAAVMTPALVLGWLLSTAVIGSILGLIVCGVVAIFR